ncbi:lysozyme [Phaeovulum sp. W22_SRMD_FR3]|uniref:lysozyme n=1 Tax=Phaeovulum sp. W22_SRMD_FR3 TaxID=3240274 RepID=UPI003F969B32
MIARIFLARIRAFLRGTLGAVGKQAPGWLLICTAAVSGFEGLRLIAYRDPVGIPTFCFGETEGVRMGDRATPAQCADLLRARLIAFDAGLARCYPGLVQQPDRRRAALVSWAYNVGLGAACGSTLIRLAKAGEIGAACDQLPRWNKATKAGIRVVLPGLTKRRAEERAMCREGLA